MTPDERQMISGLFDRIRSQAAAQRDPQAESLISDSVRAQPYAPYLMAQTVLVQEQALGAAAERIKALEARVQSFESNQQQQPAAGGFLGNIGRSIFGGNEQPPQRPFAQQSGPPPQNYAPQPGYQPQQPAPGPWSQPQAGGGMFGGGGYMRGALGMAAGVAGGALLADGIRDLFGGHGGMGGGFGGFGGGGSNVENVFIEQPGAGGMDQGGAYQADYPDPGVSDAGFDSNLDSNDDYNV